MALPTRRLGSVLQHLLPKQQQRQQPPSHTTCAASTPTQQAATAGSSSCPSSGACWQCVNRQAEWQPRDSQGELVHDGRMVILGGWFEWNMPNPRDVWSSVDGVSWSCAAEEAPWVHSDLPASFSYNGFMWIMGGRKVPGTDVSNTIWRSVDGVAWMDVGRAGWKPRTGPAFTPFKGRMFVLGGTSNFYEMNADTLSNDVWSSVDGVTWECHTAQAPWSPRAYACAAAFAGKLWIVGGCTGADLDYKRDAALQAPGTSAASTKRKNEQQLNDVWCSTDGTTWTQVAAAAPWLPRQWHSMCVFQECLVVLGGWSQPHGNRNDCWVSHDGTQWTELASSQSDKEIWSPRHAFSALAFNDSLFVIGGCADAGLDSEVWRLSDLGIQPCSRGQGKQRQRKSGGTLGDGLCAVGRAGESCHSTVHQSRSAGA